MSLYLAQDEFDQIAERINTRPRRVSGWNTSEDLYHLAAGDHETHLG